MKEKSRGLTLCSFVSFCLLYSNWMKTTPKPTNTGLEFIASVTGWIVLIPCRLLCTWYRDCHIDQRACQRNDWKIDSLTCYQCDISSISAMLLLLQVLCPTCKAPFPCCLPQVPSCNCKKVLQFSDILPIILICNAFKSTEYYVWIPQ